MDARTTVAAALVFAVLILLAVIALATFGDHPYRYYSLDPARTLSASPLVGLMSHTGVLLAWGAAAVCFFAGLFAARARGWRFAMPLLILGVGVGYLAVDDLFMFHEDIYPTWLNIPEKFALGTYAIALVATLWWFRDFFRRNEWQLLALALAALAAALALDTEVRKILVDETVQRWFEDGTKLVGLSLLAAYLVRLSARVLVEAYPLAEVESTGKHLDSSSGRETAAVGARAAGDT